MDITGIKGAADEITKRTVPETLNGIHEILDRLNNTTIVMDFTPAGPRWTLNIPPRKS